MDDQQEIKPDDTLEVPEEISKPAPMGRNFYLVMALIAILVILILFLNIPGTKASAATTLTRSNWTVQSYVDSSGTLVSVENGSSITAQFDSLGKVTGKSGCNFYAASYTVKDYSLSVMSLAITEMYCFSPGVMDQESAYIADLENSTSIRIRSNDLYLYDPEGKQRIIFNQTDI